MSNNIKIQSPFTFARWAKLIGAIILSIVMVVTSLYILLYLQKSDPDLQKWAYGLFGTVVGYWIKD